MSFSCISFLSFQETAKMESKEYKGTKIDFSYFVGMALQNNMAWKTLAIILKELAPTLDETREVVSILLKELEAMQSILKAKDKELEMYRNNGSLEDPQNISLETKTIPDVIQEYEQQSSVTETEASDDEIEVFEVVKESIIKEMPYECKMCKKRFRQSIHLKRHAKEQHTDPPCNTSKNIKTSKSTPEPNESIYTSVRKIQCFTCTKRFHSNSSLLKHELIHSGEKSFQSNTYDEEFRFENALKKHERIHVNKTIK